MNCHELTSPGGIKKIITLASRFWSGLVGACRGLRAALITSRIISFLSDKTPGGRGVLPGLCSRQTASFITATCLERAWLVTEHQIMERQNFKHFRSISQFAFFS